LYGRATIPGNLPDFSDRPPDVESPEPERFQVSLAALLIVMIMCAVSAAALRWSGLSSDMQAAGFAVGGIFLAYLTWRWAAAWRRFDRWNRIQRHRAELEDWARERQKQLKQSASATDSLPPQE
jgi:hypothetical protein